jgi:hypothetical protein
MKTILYNADTAEIIGTYKDGYRVDGKPEAVDPPVYELPYTTTTPPTINEETHYLISKHEVDMELKQYKQVWEVREMPPPPEPQPDLSEVIKLIIKKVVDGIDLTETETLILKSYDHETDI